MTTFQINLNVAKGLFKKWKEEQDTSILYAYDADKYLMDLLGFQIKLMVNDESDEEIGRYVKEYMKFVDDELEKIRNQQ